MHTSGPPDIECGNDYDPSPTDGTAASDGLVCTTPLAGTPGTGNVCRMMHGNVTTAAVGNKMYTGIRVYKDKLDRWASSRAMWNQHAYSITNINDDSTIPKTSAWAQNYKDPETQQLSPNKQGATSADLADITGALDPTNVCQLNKDGTVTFTGNIRNRGLRGVGQNMPATFYLGGGDAGPLGMALCNTTTMEPLAAGACKPIVCNIARASVPDNSTITMIVNDAGGGAPGANRIVDECKYDNNIATIQIGMCQPPPK